MFSVVLLGGLAVLAAALLVAGLRWPVLLVLGVLFTMSLDHLGRLGLGFLTANNLLKSATVAAVLLRLVLGGERIRLPAMLLHFVPFLAVAGLASFYSPEYVVAFNSWMRLVFIWVFTLIIANVLRGERELKLVVVVMAVVLATISVLAVVQASQAFSEGLLAIRRLGQAYSVGVRASATFFNPNKMAVHLGGMSILVFAGLPSIRRRWFRLFCFGSVLAGLLAILVSLSRSGFLMVGVAALGFLLSRRHRRHALALILLGLLAVTVILTATPYRDPLLDRFGSFGSLGDDSSGQARTSLLITGLYVFGDGPNALWGTGYKGYTRAMQSHLYPLMSHDAYYHTGIRNGHNVWIAILAELGVLGMLAILLFFATLYREFARLHRSRLSELQRCLLIGLVIYVSAKLVDFNLNPEFEENMFWYALGILGALSLSAANASTDALPHDRDYQ